jgi:hypothetical protein
MPPGHHPLDDLLLDAPEGVEAEDGLQNFVTLAGHRDSRD